MNALILAAGLGTRLRPFTLHHPKALAEVEGEPMLHRVIMRLIDEGAGNIVVNTHHFSSQIIEFLESKSYGIPIKVSDESAMLLDTGGGLRKAMPLFGNGNPVLVHNVDILSNAPLKGIYEYHAQHNCDITLTVSERESSRKLLFDREGRLRGWTDIAKGKIRPDNLQITPELTPYAFSGIYVVSAKIEKYLDEFGKNRANFPIMDFLLSMTEELNIRQYYVKNLKMLDIGKPEALSKASEFLINNDGH